MSYRVDFFAQNRKKARVNRKTTTYGGHKYDSLLEAAYAEDLDWRLKAKEIKFWSPHPNLDFCFINPKNGERVYLFNYKIDFLVEHLDGQIEYVEVKSSYTATFTEFKNKWKLVATLWEFSDYADALLTMVKK